MTSKTIIVKPVSSKCNLRCRYCYNGIDARRHSTVPPMSVELVELLHQALPALGADNISLIWHGGEPLLRGLHFYKEVVSIQKQLLQALPNMTIRNGVQTNATLLTDGWVQFFATNDWRIGTSLDGPKPLHDAFRLGPGGVGSFERVTAGIRNAQDAGATIGFIAVITSETLKYSPEVLFKFWTSIEPRFAISPCWEAPKNGVRPAYVAKPEEYVEYMKALFDVWWNEDNPNIQTRLFNSLIQGVLGGRPTTCAFKGNCGSFLSVDADGGVYPCGKFSGIPEFYLGNIREQSLLTILHSRAYQEYLATARHVPNECRSCKWLTVCNNGCTYDRYIGNGKFEELTPFCFVWSDLYEYVESTIHRTLDCM